MTRRECDGCGETFDDDRDPVTPHANTNRCEVCGHDNGPSSGENAAADVERDGDGTVVIDTDDGSVRISGAENIRLE